MDRVGLYQNLLARASRIRGAVMRQHISISSWSGAACARDAGGGYVILPTITTTLSVNTLKARLAGLSRRRRTGFASALVFAIAGIQDHD